MSSSYWWGNYRPTLHAHSGDLQATDLIECTSIVAGVPVNTAITGQQIIDAASGGSTSWGNIGGTLSNQTDLQTELNNKQATLVSGTTIKTVNSTSLLGSGDIAIASSPYTLIGNQTGVAVVGTTSNTISASQLIPGGTLTTGNVLQIRSKIYKISGSASTSIRMYINTSNSLTGATLIGTAAAMTTQNIQAFWRDHYFNGTHLLCYIPTTAISSDITSSTISLVPFVPAVSYYIIFALQQGNLTDTASFCRTTIMKYA